MSLHKLSAGDGYSYLTRQVAAFDATDRGHAGLSDYYSQRGESPGQWLGSALADVDLQGGQEVTAAQMAALFGQGKHPNADAITEQVMDKRAGGSGRPQGTQDAIRLGAPFAVIDCAPAFRVAVAKACTRVNAGLGMPHDRPLAAAQRAAVRTRGGRNGVQQLDTTGMLAAAFEHRDSRAGDPDLHTHVAVSSKVRVRTPDGTPGRWLSLDGRVLFKATVSASERYNTRLEAELHRRLGLSFTPRADADADAALASGRRTIREVTGVPEQVVTHWSSRRARIDVRRAELAVVFQSEHGRPPTPVEAIKLRDHQVSGCSWCRGCVAAPPQDDSRVLSCVTASTATSLADRAPRRVWRSGRCSGSSR